MRDQDLGVIRGAYLLEIRKLLESTSFALDDVYKQDYGRFVAEVTDQRDGITKVLKVLDETLHSKEKADLEHLISRQICLHGNPQHIVRILDEVFSIRGRWAFLMEAGSYSLQTLFNHFKQASHTIEPQVAMDYLEQICKGVIEIHNIGYSHNDIKPANIIAFEGPGDAVIFKVGDFGSSKEQAVTTNTREGTVGYMAPENRFSEPHKFSIASDIYPLGVIAYQLFHPNFEMPFEGCSAAELLEHQSDPSQKRLKKRLKELKASRKVIDSILASLLPDPNERNLMIDDFFSLFAGRKISDYGIKSEIRNYHAFLNRCNILMRSLDNPQLHQSTRYGTASVEDIWRIRTAYDEIIEMVEQITSAPELFPKHFIVDVQDTMQTLTGRIQTEAMRDRAALESYITQMAHGEPKENLDEIYRLMLISGPPLTDSEQQRRRLGLPGKDRYTLDEINAGKYREAIPTEVRRALKL